MPTLSHLAETAVYVTDLPAAREFYTAVLQLPVILEFSDSCFLQISPHATLILFDVDQLADRESIIPAHGARGPGHVALSIPADAFAQWQAHLQTHGVAIEHIHTWPQGTRSLYFRDPAGNSLELIEDTHYPAVWPGA